MKYLSLVIIVIAFAGCASTSKLSEASQVCMMDKVKYYKETTKDQQVELECK